MKKDKENEVEHHDLTLERIGSKMNAFSVFQSGKKQFIKAQQLVPLELNKDEDERQEAQEAFYRERLFDLFMNFDTEQKSLQN